MTKIGFHASHEQFSPRRLLTCAKRAQDAGFDAGMCSDHFHPWSERQAHCGFAWSWLGSALEATQLSFGTVCAPGQRYHPAIIAQAAATLAEMYPRRFWLAVGSGEFLNEHITGQSWPSREDRDARLNECVNIIRALWNGETVTHQGRLHVERARLHTRPEKPPPIIGAALTPQAAEWMGAWADGLITVGGEANAMRDVIAAFHRGGGNGKPVFVQVALCFGRTEEDAIQEAHHQWRHCVLDGHLFADLATPAEFDDACAGARPEEVRAKLHVSSSPQQHLEWLQRYLELPLAAIFLHHVGRDLERFIDVFGEHVLPRLARAVSPQEPK
jgi:coenzyme F420-dependent glucose-6-phosphate dehydrogenase